MQEMTLEATVVVLQGIKEASDAFPLLKSAASAILLLIDTVQVLMHIFEIATNNQCLQSFKRNKEDWLNLARVVAERVASIGRYAGDYPPPSLSAALENINKYDYIFSRLPLEIHTRLIRLLGEITAEIVNLQGRSNLRRIFSMNSDKEKMATFYGLMKTEIDTLTVSFRLSKKKTDCPCRYYTS